MTADPVARFAAVAEAFTAWARDGTDTGEVAARNALLHLTRLYLAGLELPPHSSASDSPEAGDVDRTELQSVTAAIGRRMPLGYYGEVFDPNVVPPVEPVIGCIVDDLGDIYRNVAGGLQAYRAGWTPTALWEWGFLFQIHWGEHATGAIRALHAWLAENAPARLAADPPA